MQDRLDLNIYLAYVKTWWDVFTFAVLLGVGGGLSIDKHKFTDK
jgi:hypothetical protein